VNFTLQNTSIGAISSKQALFKLDRIFAGGDICYDNEFKGFKASFKAAEESRSWWSRPLFSSRTHSIDLKTSFGSTTADMASFGIGTDDNRSRNGWKTAANSQQAAQPSKLPIITFNAVFLAIASMGNSYLGSAFCHALNCPTAAVEQLLLAEVLQHHQLSSSILQKHQLGVP
jgi:hypothetical protein